MADREYIVTFNLAGRARVRFPGASDKKLTGWTSAVIRPPDKPVEYHVVTSSPGRAEQIARVMKGAQR